MYFDCKNCRFIISLRVRKFFYVELAMVKNKIIWPEHWECEFCGMHQETQQNRDEIPVYLDVGKGAMGQEAAVLSAVRCLNPSCNKISIRIILFSNVKSSSGNYGEWQKVSSFASYPVQAINDFIRNKKMGHKVEVYFEVGYPGKKFVMSNDVSVVEYKVIPEIKNKTLPTYIPKPISEDYLEAWLIVGKSPKAAATLARRCLQGMIRDFCGISKGTLKQEIDEVKNIVNSAQGIPGVTLESVEAIDLVRKMGNIGAHMEKDINNIIEIDEGEAEVLLEVVDILIKDWYVQRESRQNSLMKLKSITQSKGL